MTNPHNPYAGMPPMQHAPMGRPSGMPSRPSIVRQGTSRVVPVVVSAGLAVGVFCGLLFGLGTGDEPAVATASTGNNVKPIDPAELKPVPVPVPTPPARPAAAAPAPAAGTGSATSTAAAGSAAAPATMASGAGSGSAAGSAQPAIRKATLTFEIEPQAAAATAKVTVDKVPVAGLSTEIDLGSAGKKDVKIVVKASGYKAVEQKLTIDDDMKVNIEMIKRPASLPRPPSDTSTNGGDGGGLIDI